jgi:phosphatidylglycerol---prolipoprotein diacylglyceryl transferase
VSRRWAYPAFLYAGCVAGVLAGAAAAHASGLDAAQVAAATIVLLVPALAGSRLLYVAQHPDRFRREPQRIWRRSDGGASLLGGLVLSVACSGAVLALFDLPFWRFWDAAAITMLVGLALTRVGCLLHGCCAGRVGRVPTQLAESAWAVVVLVVALAAREELSPGVLVAGVVTAYAALRVALEPSRLAARTSNVLLFGMLMLASGAALGWRLAA